MGATIADEKDVKEQPAILAWFDWAKKLTTGLGASTEWNAQDENNFNSVLYSLVGALHHRPGDKVSDMLDATLAPHAIEPPVRLVAQQGHQITLETITLFMLERLASRVDRGGQEQAFDIAEELRATTSPSSIFGAQLQLFQMSLTDGNPDLIARNREEWSNSKEVLQRIASAQRTINASSFSGEVYRNADSFMRNFFAQTPRLEAA